MVDVKKQEGDTMARLTKDRALMRKVALQAQREQKDRELSGAGWSEEESCQVPLASLWATAALEHMTSGDELDLEGADAEAPEESIGPWSTAAEASEDAPDGAPDDALEADELRY